MNRVELLMLLAEEERVDMVEQKVLIRTEKQLLPNATYEFEFHVENGAQGPIILSPTTLASTSD